MIDIAEGSGRDSDSAACQSCEDEGRDVASILCVCDLALEWDTLNIEVGDRGRREIGEALQAEERNGFVVAHDVTRSVDGRHGDGSAIGSGCDSFFELCSNQGDPVQAILYPFVPTTMLHAPYW